VILTNENNNPAAGETVKFTSDLGIIGQTAVVDSSGRASVILRSAPVNGVCKVEATAVGRNLAASTEILFSGVSLQLTANRSDLKVDETAIVEAFLKDASGNPIAGDDIAFTVASPGKFDNGNTSYSTVLNPNGKALVRITSSASGKVRIKGAALNTADSLDLTFTNNSLKLAVSKPSLAVGGKDSTLVSATYVDGSNNPVAGAAIHFAANAGSIATASAVTDANGKAVTWLRSASFSGTATVQADAPAGSAQIDVSFNPATAASIKLTVTADNIGVNGGMATLRAVVADADGNVVSGEDVNFRLLKGPGGGEAITKTVAQTQAGVAVSQLLAGSIPSGYRGTLVVASVGNIADTSKLTISGPAHIVTVSRPESDTIKVQDVGAMGESTFEFFIGGVVQDVNGNAVADGTEVHFSASVTGMAIGQWVFNGLTKDSTGYKVNYRGVVKDLVPFEDVNDNAKIDPGIDLNLDGIPDTLRRGEDRNGDGKYDYNPAVHDKWFDFNGNGRCDADSGEGYTTIGKDTIGLDINHDGKTSKSEVLLRRNPSFVGPGCNLPPSGDYPYHEWEARDYLPALEFTHNDFAVAIDVSAVTKNGVANARIRYPRQFANRLFVTVNAEANGVRDRDGERFILPQIVK
jgi:hypothetical protein